MNEPTTPETPTPATPETSPPAPPAPAELPTPPVQQGDAAALARAAREIASSQHTMVRTPDRKV